MEQLSYILASTGSSILALLASLVAGFIMGFINGILVTKLKTPSLIVTLAMQFVWIGAAQILSKAKVTPIEHARELLINKILVGRIGGVFPMQALWAFAIAIILGIILNRHRFGENVMVIGDNSATSKMMGINVDRTIIAVFSLTGLLAAFSSTLLTLDMAAWWPTFGPGYLLTTIAAVFLGGTSIYGGEGSIFGTVIGAFIMGSMTAGIVASGVGEVWISFAQGMVLIFAILLNTFIHKRIVA